VYIAGDIPNILGPLENGGGDECLHIECGPGDQAFDSAAWQCGTVKPAERYGIREHEIRGGIHGGFSAAATMNDAECLKRNGHMDNHAATLWGTAQAVKPGDRR